MTITKGNYLEQFLEGTVFDKRHLMLPVLWKSLGWGKTMELVAFSSVDETRFTLNIFGLNLFWVTMLMSVLFNMFLSLWSSLVFPEFSPSLWNKVKSSHENGSKLVHQNFFVSCVFCFKTLLVALMFFGVWHERIYGTAQRMNGKNQLNTSFCLQAAGKSVTCELPPMIGVAGKINC